jgi:hypothetical protein
VRVVDEGIRRRPARVAGSAWDGTGVRPETGVACGRRLGMAPIGAGAGQAGASTSWRVDAGAARRTPALGRPQGFRWWCLSSGRRGHDLMHGRLRVGGQQRCGGRWWRCHFKLSQMVWSEAIVGRTGKRLGLLYETVCSSFRSVCSSINWRIYELNRMVQSEATVGHMGKRLGLQ